MTKRKRKLFVGISLQGMPLFSHFWRSSFAIHHEDDLRNDNQKIMSQVLRYHASKVNNKSTGKEKNELENQFCLFFCFPRRPWSVGAVLLLHSVYFSSCCIYISRHMIPARFPSYALPFFFAEKKFSVNKVVTRNCALRKGGKRGVSENSSRTSIFIRFS